MSEAPRDQQPVLGAQPRQGGVQFSVWSEHAESIDVSIFDEDGKQETARHMFSRGADGVFSGFVAGIGEGTKYGYRADGAYDPDRGFWFDPDKLLVDPYTHAIDRPFIFDGRLSARRGEGSDTADLVPKSIVTAPLPALPVSKPLWQDGGLIYEVAVRSFTMRHPDIPERLRGTVGALAHPAIIAHLKKIGVTAVELMPLVAWMDERHLPPLGLHNAWGYNPVAFMALEPRIVPGGLAELRGTVAALHEAGIGVLLDVVFNHTAESDRLGPTIGLRGLDALSYYRHRPVGGDGRVELVNDTGTGNTLACHHPRMRELILESMRHFVRAAGIDGFRFDLGTVLGRGEDDFRSDAGLFRQMLSDPILGDRVLIAEPWDIGPGGYQLGNFPPAFLEWNDRYRDDVRRFWRGDGGVGALATRLAGSSDIFAAGSEQTRSVNFLAAHDGFSLCDLVSYERKHNEANGEDNRDGHDENLSWNNGVEGDSDDPNVKSARRRDLKALLTTLFVSRGAIMLTAGDEFGRSQQGNNNAYAIDDETIWLDWEGRDTELEDHVAALAELRSRTRLLNDTGWLSAEEGAVASWLREDGEPMEVGDWEDPARRIVGLLLEEGEDRLCVLVNGGNDEAIFRLAGRWRPGVGATDERPEGYAVAPRAVAILEWEDEASRGPYT